MKHAINVHRHCTADIVWVADVALHQVNPAGVQMRLDESDISAGKVVNHDDVVATADQPVNQMGADEAGASRHQGSHDWSTKTARIREMVLSSTHVTALISVQANGSISEEPTSEEVNT
jgi:hypothetical protein